MQLPTVDLRTADVGLSAIDADWLFIPISRTETTFPFGDLDAASGGELSRAVASGEFKAKSYRVFVTPITNPEWRAKRVALVGAGDATVFGPDLMRRLAVVAGLTARERQAESVAFVSRQPSATSSSLLPLEQQVRLAQAIAGGLLFATFDAASYKTEDHDIWTPARFVVYLPGIGTDGLRQASAALEQAGIAACDIGLIVLATATPDQTFPSSATKVQAALGINDCIAFDVHAVCTGFLYALSVADSMLRSGGADRRADFSHRQNHARRPQRGRRGRVAPGLFLLDPHNTHGASDLLHRPRRHRPRRPAILTRRP